MRKPGSLTAFLMILEVVIFTVCLIRGEWENVFYVLPLIIIPILAEMVNIREEIDTLKSENSMQKRLLNDRSKDLYDRLNKLNQVGERKIIDFEEFSLDSQSPRIVRQKTALLEAEEADEMEDNEGEEEEEEEEEEEDEENENENEKVKENSPLKEPFPSKKAQPESPVENQEVQGIHQIQRDDFKKPKKTSPQLSKKSSNRGKSLGKKKGEQV